MSPHRTPLSEFTADDLSYGPLGKAIKGTAKVVPVSHRDGNRISLQLFEDERGLDAPSVMFNVSPMPTDPTSLRWNLDLTVASDSPLFNVLAALDERNILEGVAKSEQWFGKAHERAVVESYYTRMLKRRDDNSYQMKVKINVGDRRTSIWVGNTDGDELVYKSVSECSSALNDPPLTYPEEVMAVLKRNSKVLVIAEAQSIWVVNGRSFGMSLNASKIVVLPSSNGVAGIEDFHLPGLTLKRQKFDTHKELEVDMDPDAF